MPSHRIAAVVVSFPVIFLWLTGAAGMLAAQEAQFRRGDSNADGTMDVSDPVSTLAFLFTGGKELTCLDAADTNDDGSLDVSDAIAALAFLFTGGAPIPAPGPAACGPDPSGDGLGCQSFATCPQTQSATVFRLVDLDLRDPHIFVSFLGCYDVTDTPLVGFSVNGEVQDSISGDLDSNGFLDLNFLLIFRPQGPDLTAGGTLVVAQADCAAPAGTTCSGATELVSTSYEKGAAATCLSALAGTTRPYSPPMAAVPSPCFSTASSGTVKLSLGGIEIPLSAVRLAATYQDSPLSRLTSGLLMGFVSVNAADAVIIPASFPVVGGQSLSILLPGGDPPGEGRNCATHNDRDQGPDGQGGQTSGWWFYFAFTAEKVTLAAE